MITFKLFGKQEARGKNFWSSECHHACMIGRVVTKVNEVKQENTTE